MLDAEGSCTVLYCTVLNCIFRNTHGIQSTVEAAVSRREGSEGSHLFEVLLHSRRCLLHRASIFPLWCCQDVAYDTLVPPYQDDGRLSILPSMCSFCAFLWLVCGGSTALLTPSGAFAGTCRFCGIAHLWNGWKSRLGWDCWDFWETPGHGGRRQALLYCSLCAQPCRGGRGEFGPAVSTLHNLQNPRHG